MALSNSEKQRRWMAKNRGLFNFRRREAWKAKKLKAKEVDPGKPETQDEQTHWEPDEYSQ